VIEDLAHDEHVLWEGRPHGLRGFLRSIDFFLLAFPTLGAIFFVTALANTSRQRRVDPTEFVWIALFPFVAVGVFFFMPRLVSIWREARGASYVITDRRVVIRSRRRRIDLDLRTLPYLELDRSWVTGPTIFFGQRTMYDGWGFYGASPAPSFRGLPDAETVYRLIADTRAQAAAR